MATALCNIGEQTVAQNFRRAKGSGAQHPRPVLITFDNTHNGDQLLSRATCIGHGIEGHIQITPRKLFSASKKGCKAGHVAEKLDLRTSSLLR